MGGVLPSGAGGAVVSWYVHVEGPDDMIPMPSKEAADAEALALNAWWERTHGRDADALPVRAVVVQAIP